MSSLFIASELGDLLIFAASKEASSIMASNPVRVRFAPSPTGPLHIGGLRTALYNYLFARNQGGSFILRIEDTDQKRFVPAAEQYILDSLNWAGLAIDEGPGIGGEYGPYKQSERREIYQQYANQLLESGKAYWAFDTEDDLNQWRDTHEAMHGAPPKYDAQQRIKMRNSLSLSPAEVEELLASDAAKVLRLKIPADREIIFQDIIRGEVRFNSKELDDKVIMKADGLPTYHLANIVDDHLMEISHVIRGEEWISSAPLHVLLYESFGWEPPQFAHLPLILNPNGKGKLSKRSADKLGFPVYPLDWTNEEGQLSKGFTSEGFEPEAFINFLSMLGWNPGDEREIFGLEDLTQAFDLGRVNKAGARFDIDKAKWFNAEHLRSKSDQDLAAGLAELLAGDQDSYYLKAVAGLMKERVQFLHEIPQKGNYFFGEDFEYDEKMIRKKYKTERRADFDEMVQQLQALEDFSEASVETQVKAFMEAKSLGFGAVLPVIRLAIAGTTQGPSAFAMMEVLGKQRCVDRLQRGLDHFDSLASS